jgi:uncharacterized membrane protein YjjP (DUF1212 family)
VILSFQEELVFDPRKSETYHFVLPSGLDFHKLILLEQLCFNLTQSQSITFVQAEESLCRIEQTPPLYSRPFIAFSYFLASMTSGMLFFGGNWSEGLWAGILGAVVVYGIELLCPKLPGLSEISSFASSFLISSTASLVDSYLFSGNLCLFGTMYGGVVWLLPGLTITIALLEVYSGMTVYGSSRLVYGVSQASQVGFGLAFGAIFVRGSNAIPVSFSTGCRNPISEIWGVFFLPIAALSFSLILNSSEKELPGLVFTSAVAQVSGYVLKIFNVNAGVSPFLCAIFVTTAARLYAWGHGNERPLIYIIGGLLVLVPGGVGVRGSFTTILKGDPNTGMSFTFNMIMIAITLAIGVFVSLIPTLKWISLVNIGKNENMVCDEGSGSVLDELELNDHISQKLSNKFTTSERSSGFKSVLNPILLCSSSCEKIDDSSNSISGEAIISTAISEDNLMKRETISHQHHHLHHHAKNPVNLAARDQRERALSVL